MLEIACGWPQDGRGRRNPLRDFRVDLHQRDVARENNDRNTALAAAHTVCDDLDNNQNTSALAMSLKKDTNLSLQQTSYFVGASISAYCPQYIGHTDNSPNWLKPIYPVSVW